MKNCIYCFLPILAACGGDGAKLRNVRSYTAYVGRSTCRNIRVHLLISGLLLIAFPTSTNAYFDPGTGSLVIQALIGALAAVTVFWGQLKSYFRSLFSSQPDRRSSASSDADDQGDVSTDTEE